MSNEKAREGWEKDLSSRFCFYAQKSRRSSYLTTPTQSNEVDIDI